MPYYMNIVLVGKGNMEATFLFKKSTLWQISTKLDFCKFVYRTFYELPFDEQSLDEIVIHRKLAKGPYYCDMENSGNWTGLIKLMGRRMAKVIVYERSHPSGTFTTPESSNSIESIPVVTGFDEAIAGDDRIDNKSLIQGAEIQTLVPEKTTVAEVASTKAITQEEQSIRDEAGPHSKELLISESGMTETSHTRSKANSVEEPHTLCFKSSHKLLVSVIPKYVSLSQVILSSKSDATISCKDMSLQVINYLDVVVASVSIDRPQGIAPGKTVKFNVNMSNNHFKHPFSIALKSPEVVGVSQLSSKCFENDLILRPADMIEQVSERTRLKGPRENTEHISSKLTLERDTDFFPEGVVADAGQVTVGSDFEDIGSDFEIVSHPSGSE